MTAPEQIRNIAVIAHVDHGKTTLVDQLLRQTGIFRANQQVRERFMDSNDIERERGMTILSKNCAVFYQGMKINLIDTPGHADFGGEVERIMRMADGVLLLVDAVEGPMPQTRFVLQKALAHHLTPIVVINKVDRHDARPLAVLDEVFDLFVDLDASDAQLDFAHMFAAGREGYAKRDMEHSGGDIFPLLDLMIAQVPPPKTDPQAPFQMLVSSIQYNDYVGRIAIGKIAGGRIQKGQTLYRIGPDGPVQKGDVTNLFTYAGTEQQAADMITAGDIAAVSGFPDIEIGDTLGEREDLAPLRGVMIEAPTVSMEFSINTGPFAGRDGRYLTSRHLGNRLARELRSNLALRVENTDSPDTFKVSGRGLLHLSVFIETMRREGYELCVSSPQVIFHEENGKRTEPMERVSVDVPGGQVGKVMELLCSRKAQVVKMSNKKNIAHLELQAPSRGLIGIHHQLLTATNGEAVMHHAVCGYAPYQGDIPGRATGSMISQIHGEALSYALYNLQDRGRMFVTPGTPVYAGMVVGEHARENDITVNPCKGKHLTNIRSKSADEALRLIPVTPPSLEEALTFIKDDELVEITPRHIRIRKRLLREQERKKAARQATV